MDVIGGNDLLAMPLAKLIGVVPIPVQGELLAEHPDALVRHHKVVQHVLAVHRRAPPLGERLGVTFRRGHVPPPGLAIRFSRWGRGDPGERAVRSVVVLVHPLIEEDQKLAPGHKQLRGLINESELPCLFDFFEVLLQLVVDTFFHPTVHVLTCVGDKRLGCPNPQRLVDALDCSALLWVPPLLSG